MSKTEILSRANKAINDADFDLAKEILIPLADDGNSEAQYLLGFLFFTGADVSYTDALLWLKKSANKDNPRACFYLSINVDDPCCLPAEERLSYLMKSASLNYAPAQYALGCNYAYGNEGLKKNLIESRKWYKEAADQGHADAEYNLGVMLLLGEGGYQNTVEGITRLEHVAADHNSIDSLNLLENIYSEGLYGVSKDTNRANFWATKRKSNRDADEGT